jgi:hypothetical protein
MRRKFHSSDETFDHIQEQAPTYPDNTCPEIDAAKDMMEALREKNSNLREGLQYWRSQCRELLKLLTAKQRKKYLGEHK